MKTEIIVVSIKDTAIEKKALSMIKPRKFLFQYSNPVLCSLESNNHRLLKLYPIRKKENPFPKKLSQKNSFKRRAKMKRGFKRLELVTVEKGIIELVYPR